MKQSRGTWATIRSPDRNSHCISANDMQLLPVLKQQLGHKVDHTVKRSKVILISAFENNNNKKKKKKLIVSESPMLYTKIQPQRFLSFGEEDF